MIYEGGRKMFCRNCGNKLEKGAKFCKFCGSCIEESMKAASVKNKKMDIQGLLNVFILICIIIVGILILFTLSNKETAGLAEALHGKEKDTDQKMFSDSGEVSRNGNTHSNLKNGGWVAEQGDWNYYAIKNCILKENVVTGEKLVILDSSKNYDSSAICNLHVMGEWIYFSKREDFKIYRMKTDGTCYDSYSGISDWDTYNGNLYGITYETVTASTSNKLLVQADWEDGNYRQLMKLEEGLDFVGIEDGYAYFTATHKTDVTMLSSEYTYLYVQVSLDGQNKRQCVWTDEYDYEKVSQVGDPYINDGKIYVLYCYSDAIISNNITYEVICCDFETEEIGFTQIPLLSGTWNFFNNQFVFGGEGIKMVGMDGRQGTVIVDTPYDNTLCVAHDKIYYQCNGMYCIVSPDGSEWEQIVIEEFHNK